MLDSNFSLWTRQDFIDFDTRRSIVMQPTQAEIDAQILDQEQAKLAYINQKLSALGITRPSTITKEFVIWILTQLNAEQFIGNDFSGWVDNQEILFGSLETAFNELVLRYL